MCPLRLPGHLNQVLVQITFFMSPLYRHSYCPDKYKFSGYISNNFFIYTTFAQLIANNSEQINDGDQFTSTTHFSTHAFNNGILSPACTLYVVLVWSRLPSLKDLALINIDLVKLYHIPSTIQTNTAILTTIDSHIHLNLLSKKKQ